MALDTGANVLALNIIEAAAPSDSLIQRRNQLNALITKHHEDERWSVDFFLFRATSIIFCLACRVTYSFVQVHSGSLLCGPLLLHGYENARKYLG